MVDIIFHPEYARVLKEIDKLKEQLSIIIEDRADLLHHKAIYWKTEYINKIGALEYELFELEVNISRTKRKIEMIQAAINLQKPINEKKMDIQLDKEYEVYIKELKDRAKDIDWVNYLNSCETLTKEETILLKKLYRKLAKMLHTDLNPNTTEEQKVLWRRVAEAYELADIEMLKTLYELAVENKPVDDWDNDVNPIEELNEKIKFLKKKIMDMLIEIDKIKEKFPFNMVEFLKDEYKVHERQVELKADIEEAKEILKELEEYLIMIIPSYGDLLN